MVLDAYHRTFTNEYYELKAYIDELLRSNPGSTMKVELCKDELSKGRRVFMKGPNPGFLFLTRWTFPALLRI